MRAEGRPWKAAYLENRTRLLALGVMADIGFRCECRISYGRVQKILWSSATCCAVGSLTTQGSLTPAS